MKPTLGQRVVSAGLGAVFQHVLENSPEIRALANAVAYEAPRGNPRPAAAPRVEKKRRRPPAVKHVDEHADGDIIDMERKPDGTYGAKS